MKLLVTADMHLGRRSTQLPGDELEQAATVTVWSATVAAALEARPAALLIVGDLVDETNCFFEAFGPLEAGLARLQEHGIPTLAVAGNHDAEVLSRLADTLAPDTFRLLGRGGVWERFVLEAAGSRLQVFGWSYPQRRVSSSPLPQFPAGECDPALPAVGMLHADLGAASGGYCPVQRADFEATPVPLWLLGHIHKPTPPPAAAAVPPILFYPGSPQGLDPGPGELGPHGPWLLTLGPEKTSFQQLVLSAVRYESLTVKLENAVAETGVTQQLLSALRAAVREARQEQESLRVLSLRLDLAGCTELPHAQLHAQVAELAESGLVLDDVKVYLNEFRVTAHPPLDLAALSRGRGIQAELARLLQDLDGGSGAEQREAGGLAQLLEATREAVAGVAGAAAFAPVAGAAAESGPDPLVCRDLLRRQAWLLLEELARQRARDG